MSIMYYLSVSLKKLGGFKPHVIHETNEFIMPWMKIFNYGYLVQFVDCLSSLCLKAVLRKRKKIVQDPKQASWGRSPCWCTKKTLIVVHAELTTQGLYCKFWQKPGHSRHLESEGILTNERSSNITRIKCINIWPASLLALYSPERSRFYQILTKVKFRKD